MSNFRRLSNAEELDYAKYSYEGVGLVTALAIDPSKSALEGLLMVAYANQGAVEATMDTGFATYWSRSRNGLWVKGDTSGNRQLVEGIYVDCDGDAIVYAVSPQGPACHTGAPTCFLVPEIG